MAESAHMVTAEELERFSSNEDRCELVAGRLVRMTPVGFAHGRIVLRFGALLDQHVRNRKLGAVLTEVGFKLAANPDTVRAPDLAFLKQERIPSPDPRGFWTGPPDLAVEVLSPEDRPPDVRSKIDEYLTSGVPVVVIVDPDRKSVLVHRQADPPLRLGLVDTLDLNDVLPGFRCRLQDIFE